MITIGILLFPNVEELDFAGPFEVPKKNHLVWQTYKISANEKV